MVGCDLDGTEKLSLPAGEKYAKAHVGVEERQDTAGRVLVQHESGLLSDAFRSRDRSPRLGSA